MCVMKTKEKFQQLQLSSAWRNRIYINILTVDETGKNRHRDVHYFNFQLRELMKVLSVT